jgi:hypothetical protein
MKCCGRRQSSYDGHKAQYDAERLSALGRQIRRIAHLSNGPGRAEYVLLRLFGLLQSYTALTVFECLELLRECHDTIVRYCAKVEHNTGPDVPTGFVLLVINDDLASWTGSQLLFSAKTGNYFNGVDHTPVTTVSFGIDQLSQEYDRHILKV